MVVYHGTDNVSAENILKNGVDLLCGDDSVDNAKGFYTTPNKAFALKRAISTACRRSSFNETKFYPVVLRIEIDFSKANSINIKKFSDCNYEWKEFVFYNRMGNNFLIDNKISTQNHNLDFKYDIVINETADNNISSIIMKTNLIGAKSDLKDVISRIGKSNKPYWDKQLSIHTEKGCQCIVSISKEY